MCGGRGTRLDAGVEKPLFEVGGRPMVDRVLGALRASRAGEVVAVGSPHTPETLAHVDAPTLAAPGEGYVADLQYALDRVEGPVLTAAADLPLLAADAVDGVIDAHETGSLSVCVPTELKRSLGVSVDAAFESGGRELSPAGLNVVGDGAETVRVVGDERLAVNVNRKRDAFVAEALL
ncbi:MAG: NTP transferase domain-containing protein [Halobacteriaceae archaeon]